MRQRISHGATIDAATPQEVAAIIAQALVSEPSAVYTRLKGQVQLNASGVGQSNNVDLKVPSQFDWRIERVTVAGTGAANALVLFCENSTSPTDLLEVVQLGTAGLYSDSFSNDLYVPANSQVIIAVTGGVANGQVSYNLQIEQIRHKELA